MKKGAEGEKKKEKKNGCGLAEKRDRGEERKREESREHE